MYSYGSRVLHDKLNTTLLCSRHSSADFGHCSSKLLYLWIMRDFAYSSITEQPILITGPLCSEKQIRMKPRFSPYFSLSCCMQRRPRSVTLLGLWRTRRIGADSGHVALVCHRNVLSCGYCVTLGTVVLRRCESWLDEFCTQICKLH